MFIGDAGQGNGWGGAGGRILLVESVSDTPGSLALLGGRDSLSAALPHLGPNAHCSIVLASGDRRVG